MLSYEIVAISLLFDSSFEQATADGDDGELDVFSVWIAADQCEMTCGRVCAKEFSKQSRARWRVRERIMMRLEGLE